MARMTYQQFMDEQKRACDRLLQPKFEEKNLSEKILQCPATFDGLLCWPRTIAASTATLPCPPPSILSTVYEIFRPSDLLPYNDTGITNERIKLSVHPMPTVSRFCGVNGQWFKNANYVIWSNYGLCLSFEERRIAAIVDSDDYLHSRKYGDVNLLDKWLPIIKTVSQIGYASSFMTLIIAMIVFSVLRKLRNPRNRLHMHLFTSFIMRAFMALLKDWVFVDGVGLAWDIVIVDGKSTFIKERNAWACRIITSIWQYFIVANYAWILMEGLYLHNLIFSALCTDTSAITSYILLGWGLPVLVVIPWIIIRATIENTWCWTTHYNPSLFLIVKIPIVISILFNFVLFVNIVRVLLIKLKTSMHLRRKKMQYRRWAKSTLVLVPLFGAHYTLFLGLSYHEDNRMIWLFCDQLFASFQGAFVALLYCLLNGEVRAEARRAWRAQQSKRESLIPINREFAHASRERTEHNPETAIRLSIMF